MSSRKSSRSSGMRWLFSAIVLAAAMGVHPRIASAQPPFCWISTTSVNFGTYSVSSPTALAATGGVSYFCTVSIARTTCLSAGSGGNITRRQMVGPAGSINYNLYVDAAHTRIWGDAPPNCRTDRYLGLWETIPIYGLIPAGQDVGVGSYTDTVVVTFLY